MTTYNLMVIDMFNKRRTILYFGIFVLLVFWFIGIRSRGNYFLILFVNTIYFLLSILFCSMLDASQYEALKQTLELTKQEV